MSCFVPVGGGTRALAGAGRPQPVFLDGVVSTHRFPTRPWRILHFRSAWLQSKLTGKPAPKPNPYFVLYELTEKGFVEVPLPEGPVSLTRVPGL